MNNKNNNNYDSGSAGDIGSWIVILILMFAFWPLGLLLLFKKLGSSSKSSTHREQNRTASAYNASAYNASAKERARREKNANRQKNTRSQLDKKTGKPLSVMLLLLSVALIIGGVSSIANSAGELINYGAVNIPGFAMGAFYTVGGLISFCARNIGVRKISRYKKYNAFIGEREVVPVSNIADALGVSKKAVLRDIQAMIDAGFLGDSVYIDSGLEAVVLSAEAAEAARRARKPREDAPRAGAVGKPENPYMAIIVELRELNEKIADIPISDKIDKIEVLTAKIFRTVEEEPEKLPQIRRFMNYYLPTTLKLLHSYETLEKQGIRGENITAAKENIGRILDTLSTGFEQQLDLLFQDDAIDISADITVLERMMKQDGLSGDEPEFKTMQSGGI